MKYALRLEYDGTAYAGWQRQDNAPTVQQCLEEAIARLTGAQTTVWGASRTDAGVHARWQVAHFYSDTRIPPERMALAFNTRLPSDIRVTAAAPVPEDFHARYGARLKTYSYVYCNRRHAPAIGGRYAAHAPVPLDGARMEAAAQAMLGTQDFAAFAASGSTAKTTVRTITDIGVARTGDFVALTVSGTGFLYNMVRILAGTLHDVGTGKLSGDCIARAIAARDRLLLGVTAPPEGLTLERIYYDLPLFDD